MKILSMIWQEEIPVERDRTRNMWHFWPVLQCCICKESNRDSKIKLVLLDEAFSKMDQERSAVCLKYARKMDLQLIVCVPDERLQSLIRNVDCVYGFRRHQNQISMMHIDKGDYLKLMEGEHGQGEPETVK